ncbi:hypothetical protein C1H46_029649 [Malus baccata]|uniref:Integrase catalytic domain-containing protein n=1 Tax=Malus baccata TaxID=106549 RepID=A0A540LEA8_MALBA|nr:hypothetical protein C1H46_029649 [Malus baccata]
MVPIKLKRSNYLPWCALFAPILRRYKLLGLIDGTEPCPAPFLPDRSINPAFESWYEKDQNLLIWFNSTLSEEVIPFTVGVSSSRDLWLKFEQRFGGVSDAHIHQLRSRLQCIQKNSQSMADYLQQELSMNRRKQLASSAPTEPFHALSVQALPPLLPTPPQAFAAQQPPLHTSSRYNSYRGRNNRFSNNRGLRGNHRGNYTHGFTSGFNRGHNSSSRGSSSSGARNSCQICGNPSHEAIDCFDRMNPDISGKIPPAKLAAMCAHYHSKSSSPSWLIDSGATSHITNDISNISSPSPYTGEDKVYIGDGKGLSITHTGSSLLHAPHHSFKLNNVLHVPQMKHNLLSAFQFVNDNSCSLTLDSDGSYVKDRSTGKMLLRGPVRDGSYPLQSFPSSGISSASSSAFVSIKAPVKIWHSRLGHPSSPIFRKVISSNCLALHGKSSVDFFCSDCAIAKNHKLSFSPAKSSTPHSLALIHCDVWGPAPVPSVSGFQYYLLLVDDYTRYSWFFPLRRKSEVFSTFVNFKNYVEKCVGNKIKTIRSDSGGEFTSASFQSYLNLHGISHQYSCPHTPEQNGCVERKHRHLVETARTLLVASQVPSVYWVEAFSTAIYLINRLPISGLLQSPWELLFHTP